MAIGRLSMKTGKTGRAGPHAAYIAREGQYARYLERGEKLEAVETGNLPSWAQADTQAFWQAADAFERQNGTTYREMEIALPRELDAGERIALVRAFVAQEIGERHAYQWAIHTPLAADGKEQPHVHLMFSERQVDGIERDPQQYFKRYNAKHPEQGGARKGYGLHAGQTLSRADRVEELKALRGRWEDMANLHLQQLGHSARIDLRSHIERGTGLEAEAKQLPSQWRGEGRENVIEFRQVRAELVQAQKHVQRIVPDAKAEVISLEAERERRLQTEQALQIETGKKKARASFQRFKAEQQTGQEKQRQVQLPQAEQAKQQAIKPQPEPEQTEQQRIEGMSSAGLRTEIERLRPPPVKAVIDTHPEVQATRQAHAALSGQLKQARTMAAKAQQALAEWREAHPLRARVHDLGLVRSDYLVKYEEIGSQAEDKALNLGPQVIRAEQQVRHTETRVEIRTVQAQKPMREQIAKLERACQQKAAQEQQAQRQARRLEQAMSAFKDYASSRALKIHGYSDTGRQWKALPESMRKTLDDFNWLPKQQQSVALAKMREDLKLHPYKVEKLVQQLEQGREMGREMGL
jgi:MobA/MobL family